LPGDADCSGFGSRVFLKSRFRLYSLRLKADTSS
jgi:hypothetical protein